MKEKIKNLRSTEKGKTLFKFILYMIFFLFVIIICIIGGSGEDTYMYDKESNYESTSSTEKIKELTYFEKQVLLYEGTYDFEYKISGEVNINFIGEFNNGTVKGYKETEDALVRYSIEDGIVYKLTLTTKEVYDKLYDGIDERLFDFKTLFTKLNSTNGTIEKTNGEKIYYYENIDSYTYKIITVDEGIESIIVENEIIQYEFTFDY